MAPDHQNIKAVTKVYEKVAATPGVRFYGNVKLGKDIQVDDLKKHYDQIVYAVGNESDRKLGIPGEDAAGSHSATDFVGWYNAHPDHRGHKFDLNTDTAIVIGIGNVAIDVTRILAKSVDELATTDIAEHAVTALRASKVKTVYLLGRRGPAQAAFSPAELKEMAELSAADLVLDPKNVELDEVSKQSLTEPNDKKNVEFLQEHAKKGPGARAKKIQLRFLMSPVEIVATNGRATAVKIEHNELRQDATGYIGAHGTGRFETIQAGIVFKSVGYRGIPVPGVPFDEKKGRIPNDKGRVLGDGGKPRQGEYVVGWAKRGPTGLVGTNRACSVATVDLMVEDIKDKTAAASAEKQAGAIDTVLKARAARWISFEDWKVLDRLELEGGKQQGKIRQKFTDVTSMLTALENAHKQPASA